MRQAYPFSVLAACFTSQFFWFFLEAVALEVEICNLGPALLEHFVGASLECFSAGANSQSFRSSIDERTSGLHAVQFFAELDSEASEVFEAPSFLMTGARLLLKSAFADDARSEPSLTWESLTTAALDH